MKVEKLKLNGKSAYIQHATVGFDQIDPLLLKQIAKVVSESFGFEARIFRETGDRVVFKFDNVGGLNVEHLASAMKKIRSTPPVDFVDLWLVDGDNFHVLECDSPSRVTVVSR